jgi:hypothetical protein
MRHFRCPTGEEESLLRTNRIRDQTTDCLRTGLVGGTTCFPLNGAPPS